MSRGSYMIIMIFIYIYIYSRSLWKTYNSAYPMWLKWSLFTWIKALWKSGKVTESRYAELGDTVRLALRRDTRASGSAVPLVSKGTASRWTKMNNFNATIFFCFFPKEMWTIIKSKWVMTGYSFLIYLPAAEKMRALKKRENLLPTQLHSTHTQPGGFGQPYGLHFGNYRTQ